MGKITEIKTCMKDAGMDDSTIATCLEYF